MQSIRQYRQLRSRVEEQHQRSQAKAREPGWPKRTSSPSDVENAARYSSSTPTLRPSSEASPEDPEKALGDGDGLPSDRQLDSRLNHDSQDGGLGRLTTMQTQKSLGVDIGKSLTGIDVRRRTTKEGGGDDRIFVVGFQGEDDPLNPHNWSLLRRSLSM